jgi:hypothetical protein
MAVKKMTNFGNGFIHQLNKVFKRRCRLYIAEGNLDDVADPTNIAALTALYRGASAVYLPFGDMDHTGSHITWTQDSYKIDHSELGLTYNVEGTFVGVTITKESLDFCGNLGFGQYSILIVPDGANDIYFAMSGVTLRTEGDLGVVNEGISKITYKASRSADSLTTVIKFKELAA